MEQFVEHSQITAAPNKFFCSMFEVLEWEWWINFQTEPEDQKESWSAFNICKDINRFQERIQDDNHQYQKGHFMCLNILRTTFNNIIQKQQQDSFSQHNFVSAVDIFEMKYNIIENAAKQALDNLILKPSKPDDNVQHTEYSHFSCDDYGKLKLLLKNLRQFIVSFWIPNINKMYLSEENGVITRSPLSLILRDYLFEYRQVPNELCGFIDISRMHGLRHGDHYQYLDLYHLRNVEQDTIYPPPITLVRPGTDPRNILPLYKIYERILEQKPAWSMMRVLVMTKREFTSVIRKIFKDDFQHIYHPILEIGDNFNNEFAIVVLNYLWILHGYTVANYYMHLKNHPEEFFETDQIDQFVLTNSELQKVCLNITGHLQTQWMKYHQQYAPFVKQYQNQVKEQKYSIDEFKVKQICDKIRSQCSDAQQLQEYINYKEDSVPKYRHHQLTKLLLAALKSLNEDNVQDLKTEHTKNSNNELARCKELAKMIEKIRRWIRRRMLLLIFSTFKYLNLLFFYYFQHFYPLNNK